MNLFDLISIGLIAYGSFRGFSKGLIVEISSLLAIFLGFSIAINFDDLISNFLYNSFNINFSFCNNINFNLRPYFIFDYYFFLSILYICYSKFN